jgi:hypothetical protein
MDQFSAANQALGYLYQIRYALWLLLEGVEEQEVALETLDDIVLENQGTYRELLQTKHHSTKASLTNTSPDLWKTIRVWSTHLLHKRVQIPPTTLSLVTTATAPSESIASKLRPTNDRACEEALQELNIIAKNSENKRLKEAFVAFTELSPEQQRDLVEAIYILDQSPMITDTADRIMDKIKAAVNREHRSALFERLEGWWFGKVVTQLRRGSVEPVSGFEVYDKLRAIADQFRPDALPIDFLDAKPESIDPARDDRLFVLQLRIIDISNPRIEKAILDYYRAFHQRSRWAREELLDGGEAEQYEDRLVDEWDRFALALADEDQDKKAPETLLKKIGREIYRWMEQEADFRVRPNVTEPYVMRGSYHMLADKNPPRVWWYPKFLERLEQILARRPKVA